ncbi:MAG: hypothetical protein NTU54_00245 [Candidatus Omnitrophica bacterium]|nr:hypothetical protein [Candidatus Omnitrophota bacterium]
MMKKIITVAVIVIVVIFSAGILKDQIIKSVVTIVASEVTGAPVHIGGFSLGVFSQSVRISGFKMYNPKGFSRGILADLPKINVLYDLGALFKKKIHLVNVEIELKEMGLEKNKEGKLNVDQLKVVQEAEKQGSKPQLPLQIDVLKLGMGKIVFRDASSGGEPSIKVYDINLQKTYKNITSAQQLAALILVEPMKQAGIQGAKIYGVAMLAGAAVLPVAIAATFVGKDNVEQDFSASFDNVYGAGLEVLKRMGRVTREDKAAGVVSANINGSQVTLRVKKNPDNKIRVIISARKYLLPKPEVAGGVLYEISNRLK